MIFKKEKDLHIAVCKYVRDKYPGVYIGSDPSGIVTGNIGVKNEIKAKSWQHSKNLDIHMLEPVGKYHGAVLELKIESPYLKDGVTIKSDETIQRQAYSINHLRARGYYADFGINYEDAISKIEKYMNNEL